MRDIFLCPRTVQKSSSTENRCWTLQGGAVHDTGLLVFSDALLEEVGLALHGDHLHPRERITNVVDLGAVQLGQETVGNELNVLRHQVSVHADEVHGQRLGDEFNLNINGFCDDTADDVLTSTTKELVVEQTGEVAVEPFVREMSSLEKVKPGIKPRFLSQKMAQNEPEKKMPSTAAKATKRSAKEPRLRESHLRAQSPFSGPRGRSRGP